MDFNLKRNEIILKELGWLTNISSSQIYCLKDHIMLKKIKVIKMRNSDQKECIV